MPGNLFLVGVSAAPYLIAYADDTFTQLRDIEFLPGGAPGFSAIRSIAVSADNTRVAVSMESAPYLAVFDAASWQRITLAGGNPAGATSCCAFSPDGTKLACAHNNSPYLTVYDTTTWAKITLAGGSPPAVGVGCAWSPDGTKLAVSHLNAPNLTVYNVADWAKITITGGAPSGTGTGCKFSPDGALLAAISSSNAESIVVYNVADWSRVTITGGIPGLGQTALDFSRDGTKLASAANGNVLNVFTVADWSKETAALGTTNGVLSLSYNSDGTRLAVGFSGTAYFRVYDTSTWVNQSVSYNSSNSYGRSALFSSLPVRDLTTGVNAVLDVDGLPAQSRVVRAYSRAAGALAAETTTDASGKFALRCATGQPMQIVILDDDAGDTFNDLIVGRVVPAAPL